MGSFCASRIPLPAMRVPREVGWRYAGGGLRGQRTKDWG